MGENQFKELKGNTTIMTQEIQNKLSKENKKILELKNTITEMENSVDGVNSTFEMREESVNF